MKLTRQEAGVKLLIDRLLSSAGTAPLLLQIGAHDGQFDDPFKTYIDNNDWRAVLVEPQDQIFERLSNYHNGNPRIRCVQTAISDTGDPITLFAAQGIGNEEFGSAIACTNPEQIRQEVRRCMGSKAVKSLQITSSTYPTLTIPELLEQVSVAPSEIDVFATDTEGYDARIVKQAIVEGVRPPFIQWEHLHVDPQAAEEVNTNLRSLGYHSLRTHKDTFAYK
jgi:FkbM family methyltransferase